ncbi:MAG: cob(I)yrinic acid a,c-diamide adenosyltransferase [bacterium]
MAEINRGCLQVYTGNGKGKTTAALGLCLRAAGHGYRSHIIQFMKGQIDYGELKAVNYLEGLIRITQGGRSCFVRREDPDPVDVDLARKALELAGKEIKERSADILVLDELSVALDFKLVELEDVMELIKSRPHSMELLITGRAAHPEVIEAADLVTEMKEIKHYYRQGIGCRTGIEN